MPVIACDRCGSDVDTERDTTGDPWRCPSCGNQHDPEAYATVSQSEADGPQVTIVIEIHTGGSVSVSQGGPR